MKTIIEKMTYFNEVNEELDNNFRNLNDEIKIKDIEGKPQLKYLKDDGSELQNTLVSIFNIIVSQQTKIDRLEHNLKTMFEQINNPNEDFSEDEIEEMKDTLMDMDLDEIVDIKKSFFIDLLFTNEDVENMLEKQNQLKSKLDFPTLKMKITYQSLINNEIRRRRVS